MKYEMNDTVRRRTIGFIESKINTLESIKNEYIYDDPRYRALEYAIGLAKGKMWEVKRFVDEQP